MIDYKDLKTEMRNSASTNLDLMSTAQILNLFYEEDKKLIESVKAEHETLGGIIEKAFECVRGGGRIFYVGAGTSGRLGVLDASEIKPTFGIKKKIFIGIIAGGRTALTNSVEGAEDIKDDSVKQLKKYKFGASGKKDMVIGVTASGVTPFVLGALEYAKTSNCANALITCNMAVKNSYAGQFDQIAALAVGSEIVSGSTRLKSGTATKMALNMISTTVMIKLGKVYENYMVDLTPSCKKLVERGCRILMELCKIDRAEAGELLQRAGMNVKTAILMHEKSLTLKEAVKLLKKNDGYLRRAISELK
ncbi:MAG: N-acetylmuramic acid 6-phosphate etherase [Candidatus Wallbacteria bacterium]